MIQEMIILEAINEKPKHEILDAQGITGLW